MDQSGPVKRPRLSLGKRATQSGIAAELLVLLETVTEDGIISAAEAGQLSLWFKDNQRSDIPGIEFLRTTVNQILVDGKVTPEEKRDLYKAVERVLPPEARHLAKERRLAVEGLEKAQERADKEHKLADARRQRELVRPVASANFMVAGVLYEGRARVVERFASEGDTVFLARDPTNQFDRNAIEVRLRTGCQIGYMPREDAASLARFLDTGCKHTAKITKILSGRRAPIPVVQVYFYRPESSVADAVFQADVPAKQIAKAASGCSVGILVILTMVPVLVFAMTGC